MRGHDPLKLMLGSSSGRDFTPHLSLNHWFHRMHCLSDESDEIVLFRTLSKLDTFLQEKA